MNDPAARAKYVDAIAAMLGQWNVSQIQGWIDTLVAADRRAPPRLIPTRR